jgi:hypothetical protein
MINPRAIDRNIAGCAGGAPACRLDHSAGCRRMLFGGGDLVDTDDFFRPRYVDDHE